MQHQLEAYWSIPTCGHVWESVYTQLHVASKQASEQHSGLHMYMYVRICVMNICRDCGASMSKHFCGVRRGCCIYALRISQVVIAFLLAPMAASTVDSQIHAMAQHLCYRCWSLRWERQGANPVSETSGGVYMWVRGGDSEKVAGKAPTAAAAKEKCRDSRTEFIDYIRMQPSLQPS